MTRRDDWAVTLIAYANGSLNVAVRQRVDDALAASPELRAELTGIEALRRAVRRDEPPATVPASVWARLDETPLVAAPSPALPPPMPPTAPTAPPTPAAPPPSPAGGITPLRRHRPRGRLVVGLGAAAAAVAVVAAGIVIVQRDDDGGPPSEAVPTTPGSDSVIGGPPRFVLSSAALAMQQARTATFDIDGTGTVSFRVSAAPDNEYEVGIELTGESAVVFDDGDDAAYRFATEFEGVSGPPTARPPRTTNELIVVDGVRYESQDGGPFESSPVEESGERGLFSELVVRPDLFARLPDFADGGIEDLGVTDLGGVPVRRLRFDLVPGAVGSPDSEDVAEVWVGDDGLVRRMRVSTRGPIELDTEGSVLETEDATIALEMDVVLDESGEPLEITAPS